MFVGCGESIIVLDIVWVVCSSFNSLNVLIYYKSRRILDFTKHLIRSITKNNT